MCVHICTPGRAGSRPRRAPGRTRRFHITVVSISISFLFFFVIFFLIFLLQRAGATSQCIDQRYIVVSVSIYNIHVHNTSSC